MPDNKIIALEEKIAHIQHMLDDLNMVVFRQGTTIENLNNQIKELKEKTISCKDVTFKILGLSLATINTLISLLFSVITLKIFFNYEKNK